MEPRAGRRTRAPSRARVTLLVAIALGGALGAPARYEMSQLIHVSTSGFPWATFWTNISGAFVLGLFVTVVVERMPTRRYVRPFFATGFLGAYTTFSTMTIETVLLVKDGHAALGIGYLSASVAVGLLVCALGVVLGRALPIGPRKVTRAEC